MNIRGITGIAQFITSAIDPKNRSVNSSGERDAQRDPNARKHPPVKLSTEQEDEAFQALMQSLSGSGLAAEKIYNDDGILRFVVKSPDGQIVRELLGSQILDLYLKRNAGEGSSGTLLKRSA